ncbi:MAG: hypothetical protein JO288_10015 [Hyphomicrobiales bacterium]|nr:hypothetical protein [Hyphomicrobiales bacterium]
MNTRSKFVVLAFSGLAVLGLSSVAARAGIACSGDTCWHTHEAYDYPPDAHIIVHPDTWRWGPSEHFVYKEHPGRGYWEGGEWRAF